MTDEKLQKVLARSGLGSRREMERWIEQGRFSINGDKATLGDRVSRRDVVHLDGREVEMISELDSPRRILIYNKPVGEVSTRHDPEGRPTVYDHLPPLKNSRWIAIGRLDINTSGLLIFTSDGELANKMMHPSANIDREYAVRVLGNIDEPMIGRLKEGIMLEDGMAKFTDVQFFDGDGANKWYHCVVMEGRNREVRRLWESQGSRVSRLKRVRYGSIFMPSDVKIGTWKELDLKEVKILAKKLELGDKKPLKMKPAEKAGFERRYKNQRVRQEVGRKRKDS
jgi:23S rRNA pseudouridine2605 synthase